MPFNLTYSDAVQAARLIFIGILLCVIAYQLWMARARPKDFILYLLAAWATAAMVMIAGRAVQHASPNHVTVVLGSRIFHTGLLALAPLCFAIAHEMRRVPRDRLFWTCTIAASLPIPLIWTTHLIIRNEVHTFNSLAGPQLGPVNSPLAPLAIPYIVAIGVYLLFVAQRGRQDLAWHERMSLRITAWVFLPLLINDHLLYTGRLLTVELAGFAMFSQILVINIGILAHARDLFSNLERTIESRTRDLRDRERSLSHMLNVRRQILDAVPDPLCMLRNGVFDYVNRAGEHFFGRPAAVLIGSRFLDVVEPDQSHEVQRSLLPALERATRPAAAVPLRFRGPANEIRSAEVTGLGLELDDGPRVLVAVRDVTERNALLGRLQVADRLATVGTLAASIGHEINNPLTYISSNLEVLKRTLESSDTTGVSADTKSLVVTLINETTEGTDRIARIVRDLHHFTREGSDRTELQIQPIVETALKIATVAIKHKATVTTHYGPTPTIAGDSGRLGQVFLNLLVNAIHAIPDDGSPHSICVSSCTDGSGNAIVEISDSGTGIDADVLPRVFEPFVTTKEVGHGTGLGLLICQRIVTDHGGTIALVPRSPRGTTARVSLPASNVADGVLQAPPVAAHSARAAARVLLVDDDPAVLGALTRLLSAHAVTPVQSGDAARTAIERNTFDIILCDLVMPHVSGVDVFTHAMAHGYRDRFVLLTGGATTESLREFIDTSGVRVLPKPPSLAELDLAIAASLRNEAASIRPA